MSGLPDIDALMQVLKAEISGALEDRRLHPDLHKHIQIAEKLAETNRRALMHVIAGIEDEGEREFALDRLKELIVGVFCMAAGGGRHLLAEVEAAASSRARKAVEARHAAPNGARSKRDDILRIWSEGNYTTKENCAFQECEDLGLSYETARKHLRGAPDPSPWPAKHA